MKKLLSAAVAAIVLVGSAFAIDLSVDANFALPLDFTSSNYNVDVNEKNYTHTKTVSRDSGIGADIGVKAMLTDMFGVKADVGLYFPQSLTTTVTNTTSVLGKVTTVGPNESTMKYADIYDSYSSFNIFAGPAIRAVKAKGYEICVTPGLSVDMRKATVGTGDQAQSSTMTYLGFGAELDARVKLNKHVYINAACPFIYQFKVIDSSNNEYEAKGFYVVPKIGVGYKL